MKDIIEKRLDSLEKRFLTLYNRFYARSIRRQELYDRRKVVLLQSIRNLERWRGVMNRLGKVFSSIEKGRSLITLSPRERTLLNSWLKRSRTVKSRKMGTVRYG